MPKQVVKINNEKKAVECLVIKHIKTILTDNRAGVKNYKFYSSKQKLYICMRRKHTKVEIKYHTFSDDQINNNSLEYNAYLRKRINLLFDINNSVKIQHNKKGNIVLLHGGWHTGPLLHKTVTILKNNNWAVYNPTIKGNKPGDDRSTVNLSDAIQSVVDYIVKLGLKDVILIGHSYAGMVISGVVDKITSLIKRLVYWNAFVPLDGERLIDMTPGPYNQLFEQLANQNKGAVLIPFTIWREAFINYGDSNLAKETWDSLNPSPIGTFTQPLIFENIKQLAQLNIPKSYINGTSDIALPASQGWHPRLSEKLGLYRYISHPYDHEVCFTYPDVLARCIDEASRD
jgi:pimeloyl-ACP methyl ester carboxylesterase